LQPIFQNRDPIESNIKKKTYLKFRYEDGDVGMI